jgi:hypothetical protein
MKTKILIAFTFIVQTIMAQTYYPDLLSSSRDFITGTARGAGAAGAFGSVGADLSNASTNPAGLGLYRSSDVSFSPALNAANNSSSFLNNATNTNTAKFYLGQAGFTFTHLMKKTAANDPNAISFTYHSSQVRSFTIAVNYQRQSMYSRKVDYSGINNNYSTISAYTDYLNSTNQPLTADNYPYDLILAYNTYLIDYDTTSGQYFSNVRAPLKQIGHIETTGGRDQVDIASGINLNDKFYIGFGFGIPIVKYNRYSWYGEDNTGDTATSFNTYTLNDELKVTGYGFNAKVGVIYRPTSWVRLGLAYHMPTFYRFTENYLEYLDATFDTIIYSDGVQYEPLTYNMRTPMKGIASASFYIKQYAFISVDYEFMNYAGSHLNFGSKYPTFNDSENSFLKTNLGWGHVVRVGVEGAISALRLRAGYVFSSTPYKKSFDTKQYTEMRNYATAGIGYRGKHFYTDFAYVYGITKDLSSSIATDYVKNKFVNHQVMLTFGWRFGKS